MEYLIDRRLSNLTGDVYEIINEYTSNENNVSEFIRRVVINNSPQIRRATTTEAAGGDNTIAATVNGEAISVICSITGGSALNAAVRQLASGDTLEVVKHGTSWYSLEGFQTFDTDHFQITDNKLQDGLDTCPLG